MPVSAADARGIRAARGGDLRRAADGDVAAGVRGLIRMSAADARGFEAARGGDLRRAADGDVAAGVRGLIRMSAADARGIRAARGGDLRRAADGDVAAGHRGFIRISAADARGIAAALCGDGAARDGDGAAGTFFSAADAGTSVCACRIDGAALDHDVAASASVTTADTSAVVGRSGELASTTNGECLALGHINAGLIPFAFHAVYTFQDDGGVAQAFDARKGGFVGITDAGVGQVEERHGGAFLDHQMCVRTARACHKLTVGDRHLASLRRDGARGLLGQRHRAIVKHAVLEAAFRGGLHAGVHIATLVGSRHHETVTRSGVISVVVERQGKVQIAECGGRRNREIDGIVVIDAAAGCQRAIMPQ